MEQMKHYVWEHVKGASNPEEASTLVMGTLAIKAGTTINIINLIGAWNEAMDAVVKSIARAVTAVAEAFTEAIDGVQEDTQNSYALSYVSLHSGLGGSRIVLRHLP